MPIRKVPQNENLRMEPQNGFVYCHIMTAGKWTYLLQKCVNFMEPTTTVLGALRVILEGYDEQVEAFQIYNTLC